MGPPWVLTIDLLDRKRKRNTHNRSRGEGRGGSPYLEAGEGIDEAREEEDLDFGCVLGTTRDETRWGTGRGGGCLYGRARQGGEGILCRDGSARLVSAAQFRPEELSRGGPRAQ